MQIREQGKKLQFIRSTYQPELKRSTSQLVATCSKYASALPADEAAKLQPEELEQVKAYFEKKAADQAAWSVKYAVDGLPATLAQVVQYLGDGGELKPEKAGEIWAGLAVLQKALKKAGHPRPAKPKGPPKPMPGQVGLPLES